MISESKYSTIKQVTHQRVESFDRQDQAKMIEITQDYHTYQFSFHGIAGPSTSQRDMYNNL